MEMTNKNQKTTNIGQSLLVIAGLLLAVAFVSASATNPSAPTSITGNYTSNMTNSYPNGSILNGTRGYIYNLTIAESQPSIKWVGYVGNINGNFALQDASANMLYNWTITTITGEIYATKETVVAGGSEYDSTNFNNGGIPVWSSLVCANSSMVDLEEFRFNHSRTDEDSYSNTFESSFTNPQFYAGSKLVNNNALGSGTCHGLYLNKLGDVGQTDSWRQMVLTDATYQQLSDDNSTKIYDLIYVALLENDETGFDGNSYDFQMILPQSGLQGTQPNVAFYFYVELI
jgi:hypothetical protein